MDPNGQLPADPFVPPNHADALRVQTAAVAAQQAALNEQEIRLIEQAEDLAQREQHFAAQHDALCQPSPIHPQNSRSATTIAVDNVGQDSTGLTNRERNLRDAEMSLRQERLRWNGDLELARQQIKESWASLGCAQRRWKQRRGMERDALRVRAHAVDAAARQVAQARLQLVHDQNAWMSQRQSLEVELDGLNARVENQRQVLNQQEARLRSLSEPTVVNTSPAALAPSALPVPADPQRVTDLERIAADLADQRIQLVEAWQRLAAVNDQWQADRNQAAAELELLGQQMREREANLEARLHAGAEVESGLRQRHDELVQLQGQLIAWRARLRTEEHAWESDKSQMMTDLRGKKGVAEQQLSALAAMRDRWARRRQQEIEEVQRERKALDALRSENARLRQELLQRLASLEDEKRALTEKALALEGYRHEMLAGSADDPQVEHRLERLRRRWLAGNAEAIRAAAREREILHIEAQALDIRAEALQRRAAALAAGEAEFTEKQLAWEQAQFEAAAQHAEREQNLHLIEEQRRTAQEQVVQLRDEVERIARSLFDQPDPPSFPLEKAA